MPVEFRIMGGYLMVRKNIFVQEMLIQGSLLKQLLNWQGAADPAAGHPRVSPPDEAGMVTITFTGALAVNIGQSPRDLLGVLKEKYREQVKGCVSCRGEMYSLEVDLNSEDGQIRYIMS